MAELRFISFNFLVLVIFVYAFFEASTAQPAGSLRTSPNVHQSAEQKRFELNFGKRFDFDGLYRPGATAKRFDFDSFYSSAPMKRFDFEGNYYYGPKYGASAGFL